MKIKRIIDGKEYTFELTDKEIAEFRKQESIDNGKNMVIYGLESDYITEKQHSELIRDDAKLEELYESFMEAAMDDTGILEMEIIQRYAKEIEE